MHGQGWGMKGKVGMVARGVALVLGLLAVAGCSGEPPVPEFSIVAGSENRALEPLVQDFCQRKRVSCAMRYLGSLDIGFSLKDGADPGADAVWPAASLWIDLYDTRRKVQHLKSISQMPVILGVRQGAAQALGWVGHPVTMADILAAVEGGRLKFLMSSATQSNSGAAAYLAMLAAGLGHPDLIERKDLDRPDLRAKVKALLRGVERTAGSSGWLAELLVDEARRGQGYDAMWNYEAVVDETNAALRAAGKEALQAIYPAEGVFVSDSPLGFVERGKGAAYEAFFKELQAHLLSDDTQAKIAATGRRTSLAKPGAADAATGLDPARAITAIRPPEPAVIAAALALYQESLRKPSLTALCLDYSGSMQGKGLEALRGAMAFLLDPARTRDMLVQWGEADTIIVLPFDQVVRSAVRIGGADGEQRRLSGTVQGWQAGGGTDFYACGERALAQLRETTNRAEYLAAIIIMTDGKSQGQLAAFETAWRKDGGRVPVFGVTFGDADKTQLEALATLTGGRVFDGTKSLVEAFRSARGYN